MYLKVYVVPDAKRESITEEDSALLISVREPAQGNRANDRVRELVAFRYKVSKTKVRILTGHHSRSKMVSITE